MATEARDAGPTEVWGEEIAGVGDGKWSEYGRGRRRTEGAGRSDGERGDGKGRKMKLLEKRKWLRPELAIADLEDASLEREGNGLGG